MNLVLILISTIIISAFIMFSFIVGLHYGSKVKKDEVINIPTPNKVIQKKRQQTRFEEEKKREDQALETMLYNIEVYDGTGNGQKEIIKEV